MKPEYMSTLAHMIFSLPVTSAKSFGVSRSMDSSSCSSGKKPFSSASTRAFSLRITVLGSESV